MIGAVVLGILAGWLAFSGVPEPTRRVTRFGIDLPEGRELSALIRKILSISPDGEAVAYAADGELWLQRLDKGTTSLVPGADGALGAVFSPDGEELAYWKERQLVRLPLAGGVPVVLYRDRTAPRGPRGISWQDDETILLGAGIAILAVATEGGETHELVSAAGGEELFFPEMLPGGEWLLMTVTEPGASISGRIVAVSLETGERRELLQPGVEGRYGETGHLLYTWERQLLGVAFDTSTLEVSGSPVPLMSVTQVNTFGIAGAQADFSTAGDLVYPENSSETGGTLTWVDREGRAEVVDDEPRAYSHERVSPDGRLVVIDIVAPGTGGWEIWTYQIGRRGGWIRRTPGRVSQHPLFAPDSKHVVYNDYAGIYWLPLEEGAEERLIVPGNTPVAISFSADGLLAFEMRSADGADYDLWLVAVDGDGNAGEPEIFLGTPANEQAPEFSPDGKWIAFVSDESGQPKIYLLPYPLSGDKVRVSIDGGRAPRWSPGGDELYFRNGDAMLAAPIPDDPREAGEPFVLFEERYAADGGGHQRYDIAPDGRFLMHTNPEQNELPIRVVLNWFEELKRLVPTGR